MFRNRKKRTQPQKERIEEHVFIYCGEFPDEEVGPEELPCLDLMNPNGYVELSKMQGFQLSTDDFLLSLSIRAKVPSDFRLIMSHFQKVFVRHGNEGDRDEYFLGGPSASETHPPAQIVSRMHPLHSLTPQSNPNHCKISFPPNSVVVPASSTLVVGVAVKPTPNLPAPSPLLPFATDYEVQVEFQSGAKVFDLIVRCTTDLRTTALVHEPPPPREEPEIPLKISSFKTVRSPSTKTSHSE
jgi:hypothetical protein